MSDTSFGHKGLEAVQKKEWAEAIPLLDKALESSNSPTWLLARGHAHTQLKNYDAALADVELAYHSAVERGSGSSRKQMIEAQYRRSVIYLKLGRFADADCCAKWSMLLAEGRPVNEDDGVKERLDSKGNYHMTYAEGVADIKGQPGGNSGKAIATGIGAPKTGFEKEWNRAYAWRSQVLGALNNLPPDHPGRKLDVAKVPQKPKKKEQKKPESDDEPAMLKEPVGKPAPKPAPAPGSVPDAKLKLRVDYYQQPQTVSVTLFAKDTNKEELKVEFGEKQVRISPIPREAAPYVKPGDREATSTLLLAGSIIPSESKWTATPRKIELVLKKATPGMKWSGWGEEQIGSVDFKGATEDSPTASSSDGNPTATDAPAPEPVKETAPSYPTSSKSGPKNWDQLKTDEDEDKADVNAFFKQIYKGATPEQQRAMMKSFVESNGTALSTDWNDVKDRKVETIPPEGVEAKKWDS